MTDEVLHGFAYTACPHDQCSYCHSGAPGPARCEFCEAPCLRQVADVYRANEGNKPTAAVGAHFAIAPRTARLYVYQARQAGHLAPYVRRKAPQRPVSETVLHAYVSTACLHGQCDYCAASERPDGVPKEPASCKFCQAPCLCPCHRTATARGEPQ